MITNSNILLIIECSKEIKDLNTIKNLIKEIKDWDNFIYIAMCHGLFPLVYKTLKDYDILVPSDKLNIMKLKKLQILKQNMLMTAELVKITKLLEENNIEVISFKGPTLSQLAYGDIVSRQYSDLDLLVKDSNVYEVVKVLNLNKYKVDLDLAILKNEALLEVGSDCSLFTNNNIHIELHWKLFRKLINDNFDQYSIWENISNINLNSQNIKTLDINLYLLYLCVHGSKHLWERVEWITDVDRIINKYKINWEDLLKLSKKLKVRNMFLLGLLISNSLYKTKLDQLIHNEIKMYQNFDIVLNDIFKSINNEHFYESKIKIQKKQILKKFLSISKLQDSKFDSVKYFLSSIFKPTHYDIYFINLSKKTNILYYIIRPLRLFISIFK